VRAPAVPGPQSTARAAQAAAVALATVRVVVEVEVLTTAPPVAAAVVAARQGITRRVVTQQLPRGAPVGTLPQVVTAELERKGTF